MENIKSVVRNEKWQKLRKSMIGTWRKTPKQNLSKLKNYLGKNPGEKKLRRVHNYLGALRGQHYSGIKEMRVRVKRKRVSLGYTTTT